MNKEQDDAADDLWSALLPLMQAGEPDVYQRKVKELEIIRTALARRSSDEQAEVVGHTANCCNCGRIIDTREEAEGGDKFGAEASDGRWLCSMECWDAVFCDEGPYASPPAVAAGGVTEEMVDLAWRRLNGAKYITPDDVRAALSAALAVGDEGIREGDNAVPSE